jgi:hypothetical protein
MLELSYIFLRVPALNTSWLDTRQHGPGATDVERLIIFALEGMLRGTKDGWTSCRRPGRSSALSVLYIF